jgi:hypothetical protein
MADGCSRVVAAGRESAASYIIIPNSAPNYGEVPAALHQIFVQQEPRQGPRRFSHSGAEAQRRMEGEMSDPLNTEPRYSYSKFSDSVGRRENNVAGTWGWIAGIAVIAVIAIFLIAGGKSVSDNTASNTPPASTTGSAPVRNVTPGPGTTGMGTPLQPRTTPAPTTPPASGKSQ